MKRMKIRTVALLTLLTLGAATAVPAQADPGGKPDLTGTWEASTPDGPQTIVVRGDSTASFGEETVRWRIFQDTIYIQFGDEWVGYNFVLEGDTLTLSGGDLEDPIELTRIGPAPKSSRRAGSPR